MPVTSTFFWYDLETSGRNHRTQRIMQFAGQRTDTNLVPIGEPYDIVVRLGDDVLPEPAAIVLTGITPQSTKDGVSEIELARILQNEVCTPGTIMIGYNNVSFDDEWLRFLFYRCFYDAYDWAWRDDRSRWDLLDVIRMTRALRPDGITWSFNEAGDPINKLEALSKDNNLIHKKAHDAMSDVTALIGVAALLKQHQPRMFDYLLKLRDKKEVEHVIKPGTMSPFVYTSGVYPRKYHHTTVAVVIGEARNKGGYIVYDLRIDPSQFSKLSPEELNRRMFAKNAELEAEGVTRIPVKELKTNQCPAVAPLVTLTPDAAARLELSIEGINANLEKLKNGGLIKSLIAAATAERVFENDGDVDGALYDGFMGEGDKKTGEKIRSSNPNDLAKFTQSFADPRGPELLFRYRARNYPDTLDETEHMTWEQQRGGRLIADSAEFSAAFNALAQTATPQQLTIMEDLRLWVESIFPTE